MPGPSTFPQLDESAQKISPFGHRRSNGGLFQRPVKQFVEEVFRDGHSCFLLVKHEPHQSYTKDRTLSDLVVTEVTLATLSAVLDYRYLTVNQVAMICGIKPKSASEMLLRLERQGLLSHFGNVGIRGYGKTPKVYFLTKRGHRVLAEERAALGQEIAPYRQVSPGTRWSPHMFHRIATLDVMAALERDCQTLQDYALLGTLVEYRREKVGARWRKETTDYVTDSVDPADKIVQDAGFALAHRGSSKRALFLIEVDCGTTRLTTGQADDDVATILDKLALYDRYLASGRIADRHPSLGRFNGFHLLLITTNDQRVANMRAAAARLDPAFHRFYRFSTLTKVRHEFLHDGWLSRDHADPKTYPLIKGQ
jgi:predicted ArsR family transcriptional regulator